MNSPDSRLMRRFHTEDVYQQKLAGSLPLAMRAIAADVNVTRGRQEEDAKEIHFLQAEILNERLRAANALMMAPINEKLRHTHIPLILAARRGNGMLSGEDVPLGMDEGMIRMASVAGRVFAHVDMNSVDWEKTAIPSLGEMAKSISTTAKNLVAKTPTLAPKVPGAASSVAGRVEKQLAAQKARLAPKPAPLSAQQKFDARINSHMADQGVRTAQTPQQKLDANVNRQMVQQQQRQQKANNVAPPQKPVAPAGTAPAQKPAAPAGGQLQGPKPTPQVQPPAAQQAGPYRTPAPTPAPQAPPQGQPAPAQQVPPATSQNPTATTDAAKPEKSFLEKARLAGPDGSLDWGKARNTAIGLGVAGAGLYGLYRGTKALTGALSEESQPYQYNQGGASPASGVNQYGVPDRNVPMQ